MDSAPIPSPQRTEDMTLIDIGANLTHDSFEFDLEDVLDRAAAAGVAHMIVTGATTGGSEAAIALANRFTQLSATVGIHPHYAETVNDAVLVHLKTLAESETVRAIGETGLDYFRDLAPRKQQKTAFAAQLELAVELKKPVFLHEREASKDFAEILQHYRGALGPVVVHCFTGDEAALDTYLDLDCHIGITGWVCDERRGGHLLPLLSKIPPDRLMIETDAPYLLPRTLRPKPKHRRCEPCHLEEVCRFVADQLDKTMTQLGQETTANSTAFFGL